MRDFYSFDRGRKFHTVPSVYGIVCENLSTSGDCHEGKKLAEAVREELALTKGK